MPRSRRSRFSVVFENGDRSVVLAYGAQDAVAHYNRSGRKVVKVEAGDYRAKAKAAAPGERWRIDRENLAQAIETLGITNPVKIKLSNHRGAGSYGHHTLALVGGSSFRQGNRVYNADSATGIEHHITIKSWLSTEQAGRTLWHELTHAMQTDSVVANASKPSEAARKWHSSYRDGTKYSQKPAEIEARSFEDWNDDCPLAVRV